MSEVKRVAIFGYSEAKPEDQDYKDAYETAKLLAENGFEIVNGGGPGIMKASSEGAKAGGGKVTGITFNPQKMTNFEGRDPANIVDEEIMADNYVERTLKLIEKADVFVFFNGGTGTISEFGMAWGIARLFFGKHKPLILFGQWWHEIMEAFGKNMRLRKEELKVYHIVNTPEEAVEEVKESLVD